MTPFGVFLEKIRRSRQLRQKQLAVDLGINASYISALETGRKEPPSRRVLERLIAALDLSDEEQTVLWESAEQSQRSIQLPDGMRLSEFRLVNELRKQLGKLDEGRITIMLDVLALNNPNSKQLKTRRTDM
ncbi:MULTISPECIES: helix-turn-helix domain-containing protein [Methylomonas]|uniref:DNA-binding protein n=3 Tax=Methylomonas TaxID=416 RepID=A0A126T5C2_9GAMM|nr:MULTISPECIES: helix-turn-helix transcriptional regulator [Methylomonas]AMK76934.1 DNA-binding protein [Methylomonas denitrificans]TCV73155.1 helix-turn-helix protein [Methylomonas methanica]